MTKPLPARPAATLIVNPAAAGARDQMAALREAAGVLVQAGWRLTWRDTEEQGHAEALARESAAQGADVLLVAGGDGTVNEAVNGLVGSSTALAVLPAGTGNVMAAQLGLIGIPTPLHRANLPAAALALAQGVRRQVDLGFARVRGRPGRHFLLWAGVGLDAAVAHELEGDAHELKKWLGPAAFGALGVRQMVSTLGTPSLVRTSRGRRKVKLLLAVVANIPLYAGAVHLTQDGQIDDGRLDLVLFLGQGWLETAGHIGALVSGRADAEGLERITEATREVSLVTHKPLRVHLDAEPFGTTPLSVLVDPAALWLVVPPRAPDGLFK